MTVNKTGNVKGTAWSARGRNFATSLAADGAEKPREFEFESDQLFKRQMHRSTALSDVVKFIQQIAKI